MQAIQHGVLGLHAASGHTNTFSNAIEHTKYTTKIFFSYCPKNCSHL